MITLKHIIKYRLWVPALTAIILVLGVIPLFLMLVDTKDPVLPEDAYVKSGSRVFYNFLDKVKEDDGLVVFGTSETFESLEGNNYYCHLNRDSDFNRSVFAFGGAGRSSNVYFPLILDNPEAFEGLDVIYYINPTYWRVGLNQFRQGYFERYVDSTLVIRIKDRAQEKGLYEKFMKPVDDDPEPFVTATDHFVDAFKSYYYNDLVNYLLSKNADQPKVKIEEYFSDQDLDDLRNEINLEYNATDEFLALEEDFHQIDSASSYQYDMLKTFIGLTKEYKINCTFYLGPYNEIYCNKVNPEYRANYEIVLENIRHILTTEEVSFIDGSSLSSVPGTFLDSQHISGYGGYLTALQIKKHYEKNN